MRKLTKKIQIGDISIGGGERIAIQSMTNTKTTDISATVSQVKKLEELGCDVIRISVPNQESSVAFAQIKKQVSLPIIADIHFNSELAVAAIQAGADKIRINPGNIGDSGKVSQIIKAAKSADIPIRIGVNSGSLAKEFVEMSHKDLPQALVNSALKFIEFFESHDYDKIVLSVKASDAMQTVKAYQLLSKKTDYPLHIGVTEAGTLLSGSIKSAVGLGILLNEGIGDTMRVSLTADPANEITVAHKILSDLGIEKRGVDLISCPSCARCEVDVISLANEAEQRLSNITKPLKVAVMGCVVNGPGEAKEADVGIASGKGGGVLFSSGKIIGKYSENELIDALVKEVRKKVETI